MCLAGKSERKTKERWLVCLLTILFPFFLMACSEKGAPEEPGQEERLGGVPIAEDPRVKEPMAKDPITENPSSTNPFDVTEGDFAVTMELDDLSLEDCPDYVFFAGNGQVLLVGEGLTLLDGNTLDVVGQNRSLGLDFRLGDLSSCKLTVLEEEYVLLGNWLDLGAAKAQGNGTFVSFSSEMPELKLIRIGKDLRVLEAFTLNERLGTERYVNAFTLAEHGTKLLFAEDYHGLYVYDRNTGERSECIDFYNSLEGKGDGGISSIRSLQYMESTGQIFFTGSFYDGKRKEYLGTFGQVNADGSGLSYDKEGVNAYGDLWCFDDFSLIEDMEFRERGGTGTAFYCDGKQKLHVYPLADEYTGLHPSREGNYFAVKSIAWSDDGRNIGYIVRIYDSKSGQFLQEISLPRTEIGENTVLSECVLCEDAGRILLFLRERGTNENAHVKIVNFSMQQK